MTWGFGSSFALVVELACLPLRVKAVVVAHPRVEYTLGAAAFLVSSEMDPNGWAPPHSAIAVTGLGIHCPQLRAGGR